MKKKIKKWGNSLVITFDPEDISIYGLVEGDVIDLGDMLIETKSNSIKRTKK